MIAHFILNLPLPGSRLIDCHILQSRQGVVLSASSLDLDRVTIRDCTEEGMLLQGSSNVSLTESIIDNCPRAIRSPDVQSLTITNTTISNSRTYGIGLFESFAYVDIEGCMFEENRRDIHINTLAFDLSVLNTDFSRHASYSYYMIYIYPNSYPTMQVIYKFEHNFLILHCTKTFLHLLQRPNFYLIPKNLLLVFVNLCYRECFSVGATLMLGTVKR